jgi:transposase-like protein
VTCPHCSSARIAARKRRTSLGCRIFACHDCRRTFNERTAGSFNHLQYPTDVVTMAVIWRLRYKFSLRDVAEMLLQRGFTVTTRRSAAGSSASPRQSRSDCEPGAEADALLPGTWTRRM